MSLEESFTEEQLSVLKSLYKKPGYYSIVDVFNKWRHEEEAEDLVTNNETIVEIAREAGWDQSFVNNVIGCAEITDDFSYGCGLGSFIATENGVFAFDGASSFGPVIGKTHKEVRKYFLTNRYR